MGAIKGNNCSLYVNQTPTGAASAQDLSTGYLNIQGVTSVGVSCSNATYETNHKEFTLADGTDPMEITPTRNYAVGTTTTSLSIEGVADPALTNNFANIDAFARNKQKIGVFFVADVLNGKGVGGIGFCTNFELSAGIDDFVTFSASFELTGNPAILDAP